MLSRSSAAHQPSSRRSMTSPPQSSISIKRSGTPVSVINMTSSRQQQAAQEEQLIAGGVRSVRGIVVMGASVCRCHGAVCPRGMSLDSRIPHGLCVSGAYFPCTCVRCRAWRLNPACRISLRGIVCMNDTVTLPGLSLEQEIEAAKALFAHPPTLREVALSAIQGYFFRRWDPQRNASHLYVGKLQWLERDGKRFSGGYQYRAVIDLVLEHFTSGGAPIFTTEYVLEIKLDSLPGDRLLVDAAAIQAVLGSWGDILLQLYQQALVDYWNAEDEQGLSRFYRLGRILGQILSAGREQHRAFLSVNLERPEEQFSLYGVQAVSKDTWGGAYPEALPVLVARRKERGIEQNPLVLSLAKGLFRADSTDIGQLVPLFMSVRANGRNIEYRERLLWQSGDQDMQLVQALASLAETLLENQLQAISLIGVDTERTLEDYQRQLDRITRADGWFFTPVQAEPHALVELPDELAALSDGLPHWLLGRR